MKSNIDKANTNYKNYVNDKEPLDKPLFGIKDKDGKLIFPYFENPTELILFSEEIKLAQELQFNYEYNFLDAFEFKSRMFLKELFEEEFKNKRKYNIEGKKVMEWVQKIIINSTYGFFALKTKNRDGVDIFNNDDNGFFELLKEEKVKHILHTEDLGYTITRSERDLKINNFNVSISSAITSYSRKKPYMLIRDIEKKMDEKTKTYHKVYYGDTDSIITNCNIPNYPDLLSEYQSDGKGKELGTLKNECNDCVFNKYHTLLKKNNSNPGLKWGKCEESKIYESLYLQELKNGELYFNEGLILGCKIYGLKNPILINTDYAEIYKCRGYAKKENKLIKKPSYLSYKELSQIFTEGYIEQKQTYFITNRDTMLRENVFLDTNTLQENFTIRLYAPDKPKQFEMITKETYTKRVLKKYKKKFKNR